MAGPGAMTTKGVAWLRWGSGQVSGRRGGCHAADSARTGGFRPRWRGAGEGASCRPRGSACWRKRSNAILRSRVRISPATGRRWAASTVTSASGKSMRASAPSAARGRSGSWRRGSWAPNASTSFYDQLFVKEPGTPQPTRWHNDQPYWPVRGWPVMSFWLPLDPVTRESGALAFVAGSHRWDRWFQPQPFAEGGAAYEQGEGYEPMPDIDAGGYRILSWDMEPGDALAFHAMTAPRRGRQPHDGCPPARLCSALLRRGLHLFRRTRPEPRPAQPGSRRRRPARQRAISSRLALTLAARSASVDPTQLCDNLHQQHSESRSGQRG